MIHALTHRAVGRTTEAAPELAQAPLAAPVDAGSAAPAAAGQMIGANALTLATAFTILNLCLLAVLTAIWVRNYRQFRTPLVLGLIVFAVMMLVENAAAIYFFFFSMRMLYAGDPTVQLSVAVLRALQFVALCFLTWATMQ